ncbi:MAG: phosphate acyltransferase PlsX [Tractidigestivibacter sp.]|jgi:glycerol-3-phosphate acyltransferase PlsX|uniref:phosphate acyltransferase PlsX n=1 Tax=Tractidigestivibacter sp. TaxID=2847320 RepID=UPI003D8F4321
MTTICVDVMGSDKEPPVLLEGVAKALEKDSDLKVLLAGAADVVEPFAKDHDRASALATTEVISMSEHPTNAVRHKKDASIVRACGAVKAGEADGLFSAGSTGAVLTAATFGIGRIKGIKRPALTLATPSPTGSGTVFLDVGANADVKPEVIVQFAQMGRAYSEVVMGVEDPKVGLLCNGSEDTKGSMLAISYHEALANANCGFAGNAEGTDLLAGTFDVIVTDGFTGNVALKSIEGTAKFFLKTLKTSVANSKRSAMGAYLLSPTLKGLKSDLSGDDYGGAVLLGLKAPVVKGHGNTSSDAVCAGTLMCARAVRGNLCGKIAAACAEEA